MKQNIKIKPFVGSQFILPVIRTIPAGPVIKIVRPTISGVKTVRVLAHQFNFSLGV